MTFNIDDQSYTDLKIFDPDHASVFKIFKRTRTKGASALLSTMIKNKESNVQSVTSKRDCIRHFYHYKLMPELNADELDCIEIYLKSDQRKSGANLINTIISYVTGNSCKDYLMIKTGMKSLIKLAKSTLLFALDVSLKDNVPAHLAKSTKKIQSIIESGALAAAIQMDENTLSFWQIIRFDRAFRGEENYI